MGSHFCCSSPQHDLCYKRAILMDKCTRAAAPFSDAADGLPPTTLLLRRRFGLAINTSKCEASNEFISTDFGQHSRIRPVVFSLVLHFHGTCDLGKTGGKSFNTVETRGWVTNSLPRSGAIERRSSGESETRREIILSSTYVAAFSKRACQAEIWICGQPASPCRRSPFCLQHFFYACSSSQSPCPENNFLSFSCSQLLLYRNARSNAIFCCCTQIINSRHKKSHNNI